MKANKFDREYMSSPISDRATRTVIPEFPRPTHPLGIFGQVEEPLRPISFERSLIACHSNPAVVAEARRQHILRGVWQKLLSPLSIVCEAIAEGARTHRAVLNPLSAGQMRRSTTSTEGV